MTLALICALIGLVLIFIEFFLPGAILGIAGGLLLIGSVFILIFSIKPSALFLMAYISAIIFAVFLVAKAALKTVNRKNGKNPFRLDQNQEGYIASIHQKELYGKIGVAESDLKPSGHIKIEDEYYQAVSQSGYIKKGEKIQVIDGEGARLRVKKINLEENV